MKKPLAVLERELADKRAAAVALYKSTAEAADADNNRPFTPDERAKIETARDEALAIKKLIAEQQADTSLLAEIERITSGVAPLPPRAPRSLGEQFVSAPEYEFFRKGGHRSSAQWRSPAVELDDRGMRGPYAATLTSDPASGGPLLTPQILPGMREKPTRRLVVADLLASGTTDSNAVSYMQEKTFTNAAAPVAEGAIKPESSLVFEAVTDTVRKIAHWLPVTEEMLEDVAQLRSYIDARLRLGVELAEEDQLLNGDGVAPNLLGLRNRAGLAPDVARGATESNADALLRQTLAIFGTSFLMPDGYVLNPADWADTILTKSASGEYLTAGPFAPIVTPMLWGLPIAVTPVEPVGVGFVGAFGSGAQIFRKGGIRVEASNSHADFFIKNLVAIRAEERLALAVYRPAAFGEVTNLGALANP